MAARMPSWSRRWSTPISTSLGWKKRGMRGSPDFLIFSLLWRVISRKVFFVGGFLRITEVPDFRRTRAPMKGTGSFTLRWFPNDHWGRIKGISTLSDSSREWVVVYIRLLSLKALSGENAVCWPHFTLRSSCFLSGESVIWDVLIVTKATCAKPWRAWLMVNDWQGLFIIPARISFTVSSSLESSFG